MQLGRGREMRGVEELLADIRVRGACEGGSMRGGDGGGKRGKWVTAARRRRG